MIQMAPLEGSSREAGEGWLRVRNRFIVGADACIRPRVDASIDPYRKYMVSGKLRRMGHPSVTFGDSSPLGEPL